LVGVVTDEILATDEQRIAADLEGPGISLIP
jgi:hypothetical protein